MNEKSKRLRTISIMFLLTLTGKVLGLVRDMLMGRYFGTGPVADAFFVASQVPRNFFDAIFASAISASFIPVFNEYLEKEGREEAFRLASSFITLMALLTTALAAAGMVFAGPLASRRGDSPRRLWRSAPGFCGPSSLPSSSRAWPSLWWACSSLWGSSTSPPC